MSKTSSLNPLVEDFMKLIDSVPMDYPHQIMFRAKLLSILLELERLYEVEARLKGLEK